MSNVRKMIGMDKEELADRNHSLSPDYVDDGNSTPTYQVVGMIAKFIVGCYGLNINPLPFLRTMYPGFTWRYIELGDKHWGDEMDTEIIKLATTSDFFWMADQFSTMEYWVTARQKGLLLPRKIFGNGKLDEMFGGSSNECSSLIASLKKNGVQELEHVSNELIFL